MPNDKLPLTCHLPMKCQHLLSQPDNMDITPLRKSPDKHASMLALKAIYKDTEAFWSAEPLRYYAPIFLTQVLPLKVEAAFQGYGNISEKKN
ncbi:hypothetical protein NPIL_656461 [Nephila pilipes]|uniref:Uncharacterized protein n=1 Tax=Nephila pilipes TaxID=299642 RepID=A0A8X6TES5_NEPPI|nr:hypothetical protein NPIL_656461 [Nephila pilipes]